MNLSINKSSPKVKKYALTNFCLALTVAFAMLLPQSSAGAATLPSASAAPSSAANPFPLAVFVGYADDLRSPGNLPDPWGASVNTLFIGTGYNWDAGAMRLDNPTDQPISVASVSVYFPNHIGNPTFNLWGSFTIPANGSAILTQTDFYNFDTSDYGPNPCGVRLDPAVSPPEVTVTLADTDNTSQTLLDTGHVLDTGGYDTACQPGSETIQWQPISALCTAPDYLVQVAASNPGETSEAESMLSVISQDLRGIYVHSGPTINAKKMGIIPWGSVARVTERIASPHTGQPDDIWYHVSLGTLSGWIPARMSETYPTPATYLYVVNVTRDTDPCDGNRHLPDHLTFEYDRETAASYAIAQSYKNDKRISLQYRVSTYLDSQKPFAAFQYSELASDNGAGASGSAVFLSESIWMGGMPMTVGAVTTEFGVNDCRYNTSPLQGVDGGWKYCPNQLTSSRVWRNHPGVIGYYTLGDPYVANAPGGGSWAPTNQVLGNTSKGGLAGAPVGYRDIAKFVNLNKGVVLVGQPGSSKPDNKKGKDPIVADFLAWTNSLKSPQTNNLIQAGDYVWINSNPPHGLLVAGWGPARNCSLAVSISLPGYVLLPATTLPSSVDQLVPARPDDAIQPVPLTGGDPSSKYYYVPYVVDFSGISGNQIQTNTPRPFYCTEYSDADHPNAHFNSSDLNRRWYFFSLPDRITIEPTGALNAPLDQLYVPDQWEWSATGNICDLSPCE